MNNQVKTMDEYIKEFPEEVQIILEKMRQTIQKAAPLAKEKISYQMPAFELNGMILAYFGAFKHHIGFFPTALGVAAFKKDFSLYKGSKGSVQFPLDKPIPYDLVAKVVTFRANENAAKRERSSSQKRPSIIK